MIKFIDIPWCSMGYFEEGTRVDLRVHTKDESFTIFNVTTDISMGEDWLSCEVGDERPRQGIYIPAKDVLYLELVPTPAFRPKCEAEKNWYDNYNDLFGDDDASA